MTHQAPPEHFKGKTVPDHLKEARLKGAIAVAEVHGTELPGHLSAACDSAKETAIAFFLIWAAASSFYLNHRLLLTLFIAFTLGWTIWKTGRSAFLGWNRLERLHKLIEEERYEIQHHREQEREELRELYEAKGFSGKLLTDVVDVLMADDNRLLKVMLEEELGLSLEAYEHPLKQAFGALVATLFTGLVCISAFALSPVWGVPVIAFILIAFASAVSAKFERRQVVTSAIWNGALALFAASTVYFLGKLIL